ncbi:response regulator [Pelagibacterium halotolerans]|uniref:histidine kinase n=1 Tax=Pelagibacterium halotolerans (strain DSM 22347 / JCM 15775 / CGMCC 1.7692 / B2) TaxID=1082931 RepID=G4RAL4_PELHB|nr:response regulator [Pelagibacterium halotolerans]AEQ51563.1 PAS/PAC domain protein [Pelagibacterium halotolerans B2]QJR18606.1 response regulator [Pelagibacterium halotolerans]SEA17012.1 PAS domain S-box-containing protein [Pelagibacterium halotolerans]
MTPPIDFQALFEKSPNPYVLLDRDLVIVSANSAYLQVTGRTLDGIVGRSMFDAFPSEPGSSSHQQLLSSLERALAGGMVDHLPLIQYDIERDGNVEQLYWSATHVPLVGETGETSYVLQHTTDVTELHVLRSTARTRSSGQGEAVEAAVFKRAQEVQALNDQLGAEVRRLNLLFEQAPGFMAVLWGPEHVFTMANAAYEQLIGGRDVVGKPVAEVLPEVVGQGFVDRLDRVYRTGELYLGRQERVALTPGDGDEPVDLYLDFIYQPIVADDGSTAGIFVQGHDVTEEIVASEKLRELNESLEARVTQAIEQRRQVELALQQSQKMEALGKLTGGVAHDFNNLLQVISGNIQLLYGDVAENERARQRLENAMAGVERGAKLAGQLLAFGRRQPLEPKALNVGRLVNGMGDMLRRVLGEEIEVETMASGGLWNTMVDPNQIENALLNLAINARDAMDGVGKLTIEVGNAFLDDAYAMEHEEVAAGQYVVIAVTDTGTGIAPEVLEKVFEPFFTTKADGHGSGLGLSMVYGFIKQSGGHIKIYSEPGEGTTVKLYLPRTHQIEDAMRPADMGPISGGSETILVVEDDEAVRATVVEMLSDLGYRVLKASDAQSALAIVESGAAIDMLFTDVVMPGPLKSPELARKAQRAIPDLAVLFTSGYTENAIVHGGRLDTGVELLSKPYTRNALARRVRQVLADRAGVDRPALEGGGTAVETVLLVEDDPLIRMATADMIRELGLSVLECSSAETALELLASETIDVLVADIGLSGMSGQELAWSVHRDYPDIRIVLATGHSVAPGEIAPDAKVLSKPFDEQRMAEALGRPRNA